MNKNSIGIFDSGVGGTSIWKEINTLLPNENTLYLADSKHAPYGSKGKEAIVDLSIKNTEYLLHNNCKIIVVACNTATTNAIDYLREHYKIPFIGIEPAIKPAALQTKTNAIGILATKGTLSSALFSKTAGMFSKSVNIIEQVGEGIVDLIETGKLHSPEMKSLLKIYLNPMIAANIDHLVLGCTHYPYLMPLLLDILPKHVKIIDSGQAVARQTKAILEQYNLLNTTTNGAENMFLTNGNPDTMHALLNKKFNIEIADF
ncbi:glutamate racemase [Algibacter sp. Ld11]|uniref:glutamate racemase n=1 Tax=Algibacter sp. Ld11 TaxID=649150 RepID=UPI00386BAB7D